jgi:hypothetical protein
VRESARSPALAYGIVTRLSGSATTGLDATIAARTFVKPNALVVRRLDEAIGTQYLLLAIYEHWARRQS